MLYALRQVQRSTLCASKGAIRGCPKPPFLARGVGELQELEKSAPAVDFPPLNQYKMNDPAYEASNSDERW